MGHMGHLIEHSVMDSIKLLPFLFITYLVMEYIEGHAGEKAETAIRKSGKFGPFVGGILGIVPQCGFSAAASSLYAGRVISLGTLIAIFLSTSDEMLPILISETTGNVTVPLIVKILLMKAIIGIVAGCVIDMVINKKKNEQEHLHIHELCEHDHCHCEKGILYSSLKHTLQVFFFILIITFALNVGIHLVGEDTFSGILMNKPFIGELLAGIVGLIPNCASSVILTQLYVQGAMSGGAMMAGLLVSAGVGVLVLCRTNHYPKENVKIITLLYLIGVAAGILVSAVGLL